MRVDKKHDKGFTLVEVIVVAVIVAILAAVAIPMYVGYVNDTAQNVANNEASGFSAAVSSAINYGFNGTVSGWSNTINGPATLTWPAANFAYANNSNLGQNITYRVGNGVNISITGGSATASPGNATVSVRGKNATASW
jgi:type IV pilus assembly protein PilA